MRQKPRLSYPSNGSSSHQPESSQDQSFSSNSANNTKFPVRTRGPTSGVEKALADMGKRAAHLGGSPTKSKENPNHFKEVLNVEEALNSLVSTALKVSNVYNSNK
jgi:hypothetical protein